MMLTHLSLFTGIGGLDLAAEWAGFTTIGQVEKNWYCRAVLEQHWPDVPRFEDIKDVTADALRSAGIAQPPTVLSGGFPCQPFSNAGKRRGRTDDRYLWPEMLRVVRLLRPTWVVGENVAGFVSMALDDVLADLVRAGYSGRAFIFPAAGVGAPHKRDRVFIVAYSGDSTSGSPDPAARTLGENTGSRGDALCSSIRQLTGGTDPDVADDDGRGCAGAHLHLRSGRPHETAPLACRHCSTVPDALRAGREERHAPTIAATAGYGARRSDQRDVLHTDIRLRTPNRQDRRVGRVSQPIQGWGGGNAIPDT